MVEMLSAQLAYVRGYLSTHPCLVPDAAAKRSQHNSIHYDGPDNPPRAP